MRYTSVTVSRNATTLPVTTHASALTVIPRSGRTVSVRPVFRHKEIYVVIVFINHSPFQSDSIR